MKHVVSFSGGVGSWAAAKRVAAAHGTADLTLLFCDTLIEDPDLYRFIAEAAANVGGQFVRIAEGRTPWQVFRDARFIGNTRVDLCSRVLKREVADTWLVENCDPADTLCYVGIDWTEQHRFDALRERKAAAGWTYLAPMCEAPFVTKDAVFSALAAEGIRRPRLYDLGFAHNNCGGGCVKAGQGHFAHLLRTLPDVYATWEAEESAMRATLGKDVAILRDRRGGKTTPLPLDTFRERVAEKDFDRFEFGGCGCFVDAAEASS